MLRFDLLRKPISIISNIKFTSYLVITKKYLVISRKDLVTFKCSIRIQTDVRYSETDRQGDW